MDDELLDLTVSELHPKLVAGEVSAREVTAATLERIAARESDLRAYVCVLEASAMAQAEALDALRAESPQLCGPLHGIPVALKDLLTTAGIPTTCGTRVRKHWVPDVDATVVSRMRAAGAVFVGKVKLTEGAFSGHHPDVAPPRNPWGMEHWTGVSSSGSGVAVAGRLCHGAIGTDTGGSIRFPSAACGIVGIKATYGRVSRAGAFPLADSLDHVGPMGRTVVDCARMLNVLAGHDPLDPTSLTEPSPDFEAAAVADCRGLRLGYDPQHCERGVASAVVGATRRVLDQLADRGAEIVEVQVPECQALVDRWAVTTGVECALAHRPHFPDRRHDYGPDLTALIELGMRASALDYAVLERERERFRAEVEALMVDQGLSTLVIPAMPAETPAADAVAAAQGQGARPFIAFTAPWDYSGHPTVTVPAGLDTAGMPIGVQFVGALRDEISAIRAAAAWEAERGPMPLPVDPN